MVEVSELTVAIQTIRLYHMNLWLARVPSPRIAANILSVLGVPESTVDLEVLKQATIEVLNRQSSVRLQMPPALLVRLQSEGNGEAMIE